MRPIWDILWDDHRLWIRELVEELDDRRDLLQAMCLIRPSSLRQGLGMCGNLAVSSEAGKQHCLSFWLKVSLAISGLVRSGLGISVQIKDAIPPLATVEVRLGWESAG